MSLKPEPQPSIFIGSSTEALSTASSIRKHLSKFARTEFWPDIFDLSVATMDSLEKMLSSVDYSVFVLASDDVVRVRGVKQTAPRDNIVFELGMSCAKIGLSRTFMVVQGKHKPKLPSDLLGITYATYDEAKRKGISIAKVCERIRCRIEALRDGRRSLSWPYVLGHTKHLVSLLMRSPQQGGFVPDIVFGVSRGGIIIADLIARRLAGKVPCFSLWADRYSLYPETSFDTSAGVINRAITNEVRREGYRNVLIVDDIARTGRTFRTAQDFVRKNLPKALVKSAVLIVDRSVRAIPDYLSLRCNTTQLAMPFSEFE